MNHLPKELNVLVKKMKPLSSSTPPANLPKSTQQDSANPKRKNSKSKNSSQVKQHSSMEQRKRSNLQQNLNKDRRKLQTRQLQLKLRSLKKLNPPTSNLKRKRLHQQMVLLLKSIKLETVQKLKMERS